MRKDVLKVALAVFVVIVGIASAIGGSYVLSAYALNQNNQNLCSVLILLTDHPVSRPSNPASNPSREHTFEVEQSIITLERKDHCNAVLSP